MSGLKQSTEEKVQADITAEVASLLATLNYDKSGTLSISEWAKLWTNSEFEISRGKIDWERFVQLVDRDGDGRITEEDFLQLYFYYQHFYAGYITGFETRSSLSSEYAGTIPPFDFYNFVKHFSDTKLIHHRNLSRTWGTVLRPGLLKTPVLKRQKLTALEDFFAGSYAGFVTTLVGHPFDTIKVRMQSATLLRATDVADTPPRPPAQGGITVLMRTLREEGVRGLYKGISAPLSSTPLVNAIVFASYENSKNLVNKFYNKDDLTSPLSIKQLSLCGGFSGFTACSVVCPIEMIRTRLQVQSSAKPMYTGAWDCLRSTVATQGYLEPFRGMVATVCRDIPNFLTQFWVYEGLKDLQVKPGQTVYDLETYQIIMAGSAGGTAGWLSCYPFDVIKTRIQVEPKGTYARHRFLPDGGVHSCFKAILKEGSSQPGLRRLRGFFTGFGPCLARAVPVNGAMFLAYESASTWFQNQRTKQLL